MCSGGRVRTQPSVARGGVRGRCAWSAPQPRSTQALVGSLGLTRRPMSWDGYTYVRCGNRRAAVCPSCSREYKGDAWHVLMCGLAGGKGIPATVAEHPCTFATLTAPSFGPVHGLRDKGPLGAAYAPTNRGGRKRIAFYGKTRGEVREKLTALLRDVDRGLTVAAENWTVEQYLDHWLSSVVKPNRAPRTYQGYELVVRRHLAPALGRKRLKALGVADVRRLVHALTESGLGVRTVQQAHAVLRNALEQAVRARLWLATWQSWSR